MSILDKAKELADAISESPELRRVKETELRIMINMDAREIVEEYQGIQTDAIGKGLNYEDLPEETKQRLQELEKQMNDNDIINEYLSANQELNQILESVNMVITNALNGNESDCSSCSSASGCGGNCPSGH
ncbi:YlbF family regulator [Peptococcus simiae]|uniref:YlbF family regulator n=1 Tax=Peptococcus simiae TaxID=1643805 RepID=UPI00397FE5BE